MSHLGEKYILLLKSQFLKLHDVSDIIQHKKMHLEIFQTIFLMLRSFYLDILTARLILKNEFDLIR